MKRIFNLLLAFFITCTLYAQNAKDQPVRDTLKKRVWLLGFGNKARTYNALRISATDKGRNTNGINISLTGEVNPPDDSQTNGIDLSAVFPGTHNVNGAAISLFMSEYGTVNGISMLGLMGECYVTNGVAISLIHMFETTNGICAGGLDVTGFKVNGLALAGINVAVDDTMNGLTLSGICTHIGTMNGLSIAPFNRSEDLHGVQVGLFNNAVLANGIQFGLLNRIAENPRALRLLPVFNFNFRKYTPRIDTMRWKDSLTGLPAYSISKFQPDRLTPIDRMTYVFAEDGPHKHGLQEYFNEKGIIKESSNYSMGFLHGPHTMFENGRAKTITYFINGSKEVEMSLRYGGEPEGRYIIEKYSGDRQRTYRITTSGDTINRTFNGRSEGKWVYCNGSPERRTIGTAWYNNGKHLRSQMVYDGKPLEVELPAGKRMLKPKDTLWKTNGEEPPEKIIIFQRDRYSYNRFLQKGKQEFVILSENGKLVARYQLNDSTVTGSSFSGNFPGFQHFFYCYNPRYEVYDTCFRKDGSIQHIRYSTAIKYFRKNGRLEHTSGDTSVYYHKNGNKRWMFDAENTFDIIYYKNGNKKHEFFYMESELMRKKRYRGNGTLRKEIVYNPEVKYRYDKKGKPRQPLPE